MPSAFTIAERLGLISPKVLYVFARGNQMWRYTSDGANVTTSAGLTYYAADIQHDAIERKNESGSVRIKVSMASKLPVVAAMQDITTKPMYLGIHRYHGSGSIVRLAFGRTSTVTFDGVTCELELATSETEFEQEIPRYLIGRACQHSVYSPECGLSIDVWKMATTVAAIDRNTITMTDNFKTSLDHTTAPDGWFGAGFLFVGTDMFHIEKHVGNDITIFGLPPGTLGVGDAIVVAPGDDYTYDTCLNKFGHVNDGAGMGFFGFDRLPDRDPLRQPVRI